MTVVGRESVLFSVVVDSLLIYCCLRATRDMVLPLSEPIRCLDGTWVKELPVPKGTQIAIGIYSCNRNKAIWGEDALEWKPERWLAPLPEAVTEAHIPGVYSNL